MKKYIVKILFFIGVFLASLLLLERIMNQGNTDMTAEMAPAQFPLIHFVIDDVAVNELHGYSNDMNIALMRDNVTPITGARALNIVMDTFGTGISSVDYEIRTTDGERLIENGTIENWSKEGLRQTSSLVLKDLLANDKEYAMILYARLNSGQMVRYYTRLFKGNNYHVNEKLEFVKMFHQGTYDQGTVNTKLVTYLEPDRTGDNSTYAKVNIHSSLTQIGWGTLNPKETGEMMIQIRELTEELANIKTTFRVSTGSGLNEADYLVTEYYRLRYTPERIFLLDYEREMEQIFEERGNVFTGNIVSLGIQDPEQVGLKECEGGGIFAFTISGKLFSYDASGSKLALLFGFASGKNGDARTYYDNYDMRILSVEETGNVHFAVYGYMNRGRHEGEVGLQVSSYNSTENTIEEKVFIPYRSAASILRNTIEKLMYTDASGNLYVMVGTDVYRIGLTDHSQEMVVSGLEDEKFRTSSGGMMLAWIDEIPEAGGNVMKVMNLATGKKNEIMAVTGEYVRPLGFMGDDLLYGYARLSDRTAAMISPDEIPMYKLRIIDENGNVLKQYDSDGIYITDCEVQEDQVVLTRAKRDETTGEFRETTADQIVNSIAREVGRNTVITVATDQYETITEISMKTSVSSKGATGLTPKEVLFEGDNTVDVKSENTVLSRYYRYGLHGLEEVYTGEALAAETAAASSGYVYDDDGNLIWKKTVLAARNQIMKITGAVASEDQSSLEVCLNTILEYEGKTANAGSYLRRGKTAEEVLTSELEDIKILHLQGCGWTTLLYYMNKDLPILVETEEKAVLLTGFNDTEIVIMNPEKSEPLYKITKKEAEALFKSTGATFTTYIRI